MTTTLRHILCSLLLWAWFSALSDVSAQHFFHKKIDSLNTAYGLAQMPDGGYLVGGLWRNCVHLLRFDAQADVLWGQQVCASNLNEDLSISDLQLLPDGTSGGFFLIFRKGGFSAAPDNLLQLMHFDAVGKLLWQSQLRPALRYGPISSGRALALAPDGGLWAVHGLGFTPDLPYFNRPLLFKVLPDGTVVLRRYYRAADEATANGLIVHGPDDIYLYGGLTLSGGYGFLLKVNGSGALLWAKRYTNLNFVRAGGRFQNGDFLLYGTDDKGEMAFARIRPDGQPTWVKKMPVGIRPDLFQVAPDDRVFAIHRRPKPHPDSVAPAVLLCLAPDASAVAWAYTYETCTSLLISTLQPTADGGLAFLQNADNTPHVRFLKVNADGQLPSACPVLPQPLPSLVDVSVEVKDLIFNAEDYPIAPNEDLFLVRSATAQLRDHCPAALPQAYFSLPDSVCALAPLSLTAAGNSSADAWAWSLPGAAPSVVQGLGVKNAIYAEPGAFPVSLTQRYGICSHTFSDTLRVSPPLAADLFGFTDTTLCSGVSFRGEPLDSTAFDAWLWDDSSQQAARIFDPARPGFYRLRALRGLCAVEDSFQLRVSRCGAMGFYAPTVFSPNDDAQEDVWEMSLQADIVPLGCAVYDRWGSLVYASAVGEVPRWDGRFSGKTAPQGVYVWVLRLRDAAGAERTERGDMTLIR